jgi:biotin carboxyl carrier protein
MTSSAGPVRVVLAIEQPDGPQTIVVDAADEAAVAAARRALEGHRAIVLPMHPAPGQPSGAERREVVIDGGRVEVVVESEARAALRERATRGRADAASSGPTKVHAMIPGVVVEVAVAPGDTVTKGQHLLVIEAMKMQNELRAPRDGTVAQVTVGAGSRVEVGDLLLELG